MLLTRLKPILYGVIASSLLLVVYFIVLTFVSGWDYAQEQFAAYRYFVISLAAGFGIQLGLYQYLKALVHGGTGMGKMIGVSGTTSTTAMISCCAHYLVNLVPILGVTGLATVVAQYQIGIFWIGIIFNLFGIGYMARNIIKFKKQHE